MKTIASTCLADVPDYTALQRQMHDALWAQHPEWIEPDGNSPKCAYYDRRFAELLSVALEFEGANSPLTLT